MQGIGTVTVMVTDMVGSTELRARVGEETADQVRQEHDAILRDIVERTNGSLVKGTGDGVLATFTSAADAVSAAVAIQQALHVWDRVEVGRDRVRIGLSAGDVTWDDGDCFGTPVIEAARLCAAADGGQILAADVVRVLARGRHGSTLNVLGALELKGLAEPVTTYEVLWPAPVEDRTIARHRLPMALRTDREFPFAGRHTELEHLPAAWSAAQTGECRLTLLAGEPGIGKTRLAAEIARIVDAEGAILLYGRCDDDLGLSYQPFVEALRSFVEDTPPDDRCDRLGPYGGDLRRLCPELDSLVPGLPAPLQSDPEVEQYRLLDAVAGWLRSATEDRPVLLVLDDLHAAAKPTLVLLRHVLRSADDLRLLVVATYRDTELGRTGPLAETLAEFRRLPGVDRLSLTGLDESDLAVLLDQPAASTLASAVYAETEGNPFFSREVFRHLQESGAITKQDDRWVADGPITTLGIPEGVRDVVGRRLARLSPAAGKQLSLAAVVGSDFSLAVLTAMAAGDEDVLAAGLDEAIAARLLVEVGVGQYRFAHVLVRSTLYDELGLTARVRLHRRVGLALEALGSDDVQALAHHFGLAAAGGEGERAARYTLLAARQAFDALAVDDALLLSTRTLELLDEVDAPDLRLDALICRGQAERLMGLGEYRETLITAARVALADGDDDRLVAAVLANGGGVSDVAGVDDERIELLEAALLAVGEADSTVRARLLGLLAFELGSFGGAASPRRFAIADEALAMARRVGDVPTLAVVLHLHFEATCVPHTLRERIATSAEGMAIAEALEDPVALGWSTQNHGLAEAEAGNFDIAWDATERVGAIGEELGFWALRRMRYLAPRAGRALHEGRVAEAEERADEAFRVFSETGHRSAAVLYGGQLIAIRRDQGRLDELLPLMAAAAAGNPSMVVLRAALGLIHTELGQESEAREILRELAADRFAGVPYDYLWLQTLCTCADVAASLGEQGPATVLLDLLVPFDDQFAVTVVTNGAVAHSTAALAATLRQYDDADGWFAAAAAMESRAGAVTCLARTRLEWARMMLDRNAPDDRDRAQSLLGDVLGTTATVGLPTVERQARELMAR